MPSYVIHLAVASQIVKNCNLKDAEFVNSFLVGNVIPDAMPRDAKKESHFWDDITYRNLNRIPNINNFLDIYDNNMNNPFVLGYYTHLYLDYLFVKEYWDEHFSLMDQNMKEENSYDKVRYIGLNHNKKIYPREVFLSEDMYYGDYDKINPYIFDKYHIIIPDVSFNEEIPIKEINYKECRESLCNMISLVSENYCRRDMLEVEPLKVFDIEHIYNLMNRVIYNVCEKI